jgi:fructokinase
MQKTVLSFGEILWDIFPGQTILGGAPFNLACRVNALGDRGIMASRVGRDDLGRKAFESVKTLGMDTSCIQLDDNLPTGTVRVTLDEKKNPDFFIVPGVAYDNIEADEHLLEIASCADYFCFGTLVQRSPRTRQALEKLLEAAVNSVKLLDINLRKGCYTADTVKSSLHRADILKLNEDEALELSIMLSGKAGTIPEFCRDLISAWPVKICVVTLGERGAYAFSREEGGFYVPGWRVDLADTVGAGDAFTAGLVHCFIRSRPLAEAVEFGNLLGALASTKKGGTAPIFSEEIAALKEKKEARIYDPVLSK